MSKKEKATREYLETLSKDQVIDLCLQFMFDAEISEQQLDQVNEKLKGAIIPPVKVNQDIYIIYNGEVERRVVKKITIGLKGVTVNAVLYKKYSGYWCNRKFSTFKKTWWLTKEEAEKKLQELRGGE